MRIRALDRSKETDFSNALDGIARWYVVEHSVDGYS